MLHLQSNLIMNAVLLKSMMLQDNRWQDQKYKSKIQKDNLTIYRLGRNFKITRLIEHGNTKCYALRKQSMSPNFFNTK